MDSPRKFLWWVRVSLEMASQPEGRYGGAAGFAGEQGGEADSGAAIRLIGLNCYWLLNAGCSGEILGLHRQWTC